MFRSGMPDLRVVIDDMIAEDDKVAVRYTIEGTHEGGPLWHPAYGPTSMYRELHGGAGVGRQDSGALANH
jgi:hypothetical protein